MIFSYGTPYFLQLENFEHKEASGLQLTKSPGEKWVYLGSVLLVLGIFSMLYIRERRIWLFLKPSGHHVHFGIMMVFLTRVLQGLLLRLLYW